MDTLKQFIVEVKYAVAKLRVFMLRPFFASIGYGCEIFDSVRFYKHSRISMGNYVLINYGCEFDAIGGPVTIGNLVLFGPGVRVITLKREFRDHKTPIYFQEHINDQSITIEDDVWIGANAIIMPNVTVGRGSIVGAGAVVTKDVKPFTIVAGVPAKQIGERFDEKKQKEAMRIDFSTYKEKRVIH